MMIQDLQIRADNPRESPEIKPLAISGRSEPEA
jgi:hypothetical protein